jgi:hypothetical protein
MGEKSNAHRRLVGKPDGDHWKDQGIGGWTILKWILGIGWVGLIWLRIGTSGGLL